MPDWSYLRRSANETRKRLCAAKNLDADRLIPAETVLQAALEATGLHCERVPAGDSVLGGGYAALYRDTKTIYYQAGEGVNAARMRVIRAHEFAHYWLHPDLTQEQYTTEEGDSLLSPAETRSYSAEIAEGYSRVERREREADTFAAELLLPASALRKAFVHDRLKASQIAETVGVTERAVLVQLVAAILEPEVKIEPSTETSDAKPPTELDASQRIAAETILCPALIDAGPGTGKTRTLIARIVHLIEEQNVAPDTIVALTFGNNAAEEIRARLHSVLGERAERVWIGTFHAFGYEILKKDGHPLGLPDAPALLEPADAAALLETHLDRLRLDHLEYLNNPSLSFPAILECISRAKDELVTPTQYAKIALQQLENPLVKPSKEQAKTVRGQETQQARDQTKANDKARKTYETATVYTVYQELLQTAGKLDFGDLIMRSVELLQNFPEVQTKWQAQFPHVLADEYQDVNRASAKLLQLLAGEGKGLWVVGDFRQSIYRFRGASPENMTRFEADFLGATRLRLRVNYRSRPAIVALIGAATKSLFDEQTGGIPHRNLWNAERGISDYAGIIIAGADDEYSQADGIAAHIQHWVERGIPAHKQAILCRSNSQCARIAELLAARNVPAQHLGTLFEREEVRDMLALLSLVTETDGSALVRVAEFPAYRLTQADVQNLLAASDAAGVPFPKAIGWGIDNADISAPGRAALIRLYKDMNALVFGKSDAYTFLTRYLFEYSDYLRPLLDNDTFANRQKRLALSRLLAFTQGLTNRIVPKEGEDLRHLFLTHLRFLLATKSERNVRMPPISAQEGVVILTVHGAKGLEFPVVYLPNLVKGAFPMRKQGAAVLPPNALFAELDEDTDEDAVDIEDRCAFFVALSRAQEQVVLSYPKQVKGRSQTLSSFLTKLQVDAKEIGAEFLTWGQSQTAPPKAPNSDTAFDIAEQVYSTSQLETYQKCPRRFYYENVIKLTPSHESREYLTFYRCLNDILERYHKAKFAGEAFTETDARDLFTLSWQQEFDTLTPHRLLLQQRAYEMIGKAMTFERSGAIHEEKYFILELENGRVGVRGDLVTDGGETVEITQFKRRRLSKDDHTEEKLAVLRRAASEKLGKPVVISVQSLTDGETRVSEHKESLESNRVEKYNIALSGIRAGDFAPTEDDRECVGCAFFVICPAG